MRCLIAFTCAMTLFLAPISFAQVTEPNAAPAGGPPPPPTRLEAMLYARGVVITKGYTDIGTLEANQDGQVRITAVDLIDMNRGGGERGLAVTVRQIGEPAIEAVSYIDFDEIDQLLAALDTLAKQQGPPTAMEHFDIEYRTKGDLEVANVERERVRYFQVRGIQFLPTGQVIQARAFLPFNLLAEMQRHLNAAKQVLQAARQPGK
jgi:hypothetical protein